jgi:hypothetical protein
VTETWTAAGPATEHEPEAPGGEPRRVVVPPLDVTQRPNPPDPAGAAANQWTPLGPSVLLAGQADGRPRVAGRVRSLRASDDGQRVYAGSALGGLWYSGDGGTRWTSLDFYASTKDDSGQLRDSNALTVGAVAVRFVDAAHDLVLVGTGERPLSPVVNDYMNWQGVGIRVATGPVQQVLDHGVAFDPWVLEATNLAGQAVSRLTFDRVNPDVVWAATSVGLYRRPATGDRSHWEFVDAGLGTTWVSDVVTVQGLGGEPQRIYAVSAAGTLVRSTDGTHWTPVALPVDPNPALVAKPVSAAVLAAGNDPARPVVWMLAGGPRLWRVDADTAEIVTGLPSDLFGTKSDQTNYDLAIACHPSTQAAQRDLILVGGSLASGAADWNAALYAGQVTRPAGTLTFPATPGPTAPAGPSGMRRGEFVGLGVHPDVHDVAWVGTGVPATVWVACDGGVFRSVADGARGSFASRNTGLAVVQAQRLAQHARLPGHLLVGTQDNGAASLPVAGAWAVTLEGDAGGVAIDPDAPARMFAQYVGASWSQSADGRAFGTMSVFSSSLTAAGSVKATAWAAAVKRELANPVTDLAAVGNETAAGGTQLALGTQRVWYRDDATAAAASAAADGRTGWVTLPTATDPYASTLAAPLTAQDLLDTYVIGLAWGGPDLLYVLTQTSVYALRRSAGAWQPVEHLYDQKAVRRNWKGKVESGQVPPGVTLLEIAVHDPARGPHGSLYLGVSGDSDKHNLWWFDGTSTWQHTGLSLGSPVHAIAVDPADPAVVFAGTDIGVFKGTATFPAGGTAAWVWETFSDALPEATVLDLAVVVPDGGGARLLRAALAARGVWEIALDGSTVGPTTFLRAHDLDSRRLPVPAGGPEDVRSTSRTQARLDASPDIRIWRADTASAPVPEALPVGAGSSEYDVWLLQSALKAGGEDVPVDGVWSGRVATALTHRTGVLSGVLPPAPTPQQVWDALWAANRLPFEATPPDAADLAAHLRERPDRRPKGARASCVADDGLARVFVAVHARHWKAIDGAAVQVALLRTPFGRHANLAGTAPLPAGWAASLLADRTAAAAGQWLAGSAWQYADPAHPFRPLPAALDPDNPQVVSFDVDLSGPGWSTPGHLLLAVVLYDGDPPAAAQTDVAQLVLSDHHVAARSVRRSNAARPPTPDLTGRVAGMDQGNFAGAAPMARAWDRSNLTWTGLYLDSPAPVPGEVPVPNGVVAGHNRLGGTPGHPPGSWMSAFPVLWPDWGIAPIYWGQQDPANAQGPFDLRPQIATANAEDAAAKAVAAGLRAGAVIYLDWEASGIPSAAALTYLRTFFERLGELGWRTGLYAHANAAATVMREVPGLAVWVVSCQHAACATVAADRTLASGRVWYATVPMPAGAPDALARQWTFESAQPAGSPLLPFGNIDQDVAVVEDPAFPERRPHAALLRRGPVVLLPAVAPATAGSVTIVRIVNGLPAGTTWSPAAPGPGPGSTTPDAGPGRFGPRHWWNPFSPLTFARPAAVAPAAAVDVVVGLGHEHVTSADAGEASVEAGPDGWRVQALERGPAGWRLTTVADGGLVVEPLAGVAVTARSGRVEALVVTDDGTPASASAPAGTRAWSPLALVCPRGTAPVRPTCRPALVTRGADDVDAVWLGQDGRLQVAHSSAPGTWGPPLAIGDPAVEVHPLGTLAAVSPAADHVDVVYLGRTGGAGTPWSVYVTSWTPADGWGDATHTVAVSGGPALSPLSRIAALSRAAGLLDVLAVAGTGELLVASRPAVGQPFTAPATVGGAPLAGGVPLRLARVESCVALADGSVVVAAIGREGGTWLTKFDPGTSTWSKLEQV